MQSEHRGLLVAIGPLVIALVAAAVLLWPSPSRADAGPDPKAAAFSAATQWWHTTTTGELRELQRLRRQNRKLRHHLSEYGVWVRNQRRAIIELRRQSSLGWQVRNAIALAAEAYDQSEAVLLRKANCESHLWPFARNNSSKDSPSGLFQFRPSTFDSTPYSRFSIWDPYANALAASWMHANGRSGEWACH